MGLHWNMVVRYRWSVGVDVKGMAAQKTTCQPTGGRRSHPRGPQRAGQAARAFLSWRARATSPSCDTRGAANLGGMRVRAYSHTAPTSHWNRFSSYVSKPPVADIHARETFGAENQRSGRSPSCDAPMSCVVNSTSKFRTLISLVTTLLSR
jgi:hypothetical protein